MNGLWFLWTLSPMFTEWSHRKWLIQQEWLVQRESILFPSCIESFCTVLPAPPLIVTFPQAFDLTTMFKHSNECNLPPLFFSFFLCCHLSPSVNMCRYLFERFCSKFIRLLLCFNLCTKHGGHSSGFLCGITEYKLLRSNCSMLLKCLAAKGQNSEVSRVSNCTENPEAILIQIWSPWCSVGLFSQGQLSVQTLLQCLYSPCVPSHASTSVCMSKITNTDSHTIVWTHKNTAHFRRNG